MNRLTIALALGASLATFGCSRQEPSQAEVSAADVKQQATEAVDTASRFAAQEKDLFVQTSQRQLDRLKDQLTKLDNEAQAAHGEAKARLELQVAAIEGQLHAAEARLAEIQAAGAGQWREAKAQLTAEIQELEQSFERSERQRKQG
jgi:uncharacterized protein HemX